MAHKLWSCCCKDLQKDLQHVGFVTASVEQEILTNIKDLTVKAINPLLNFCDYFKIVTINAVSETGDLVFYTTELFQTSDGDTANPGWLRAS